MSSEAERATPWQREAVGRIYARLDELRVEASDGDHVARLRREYVLFEHLRNALEEIDGGANPEKVIATFPANGIEVMEVDNHEQEMGERWPALGFVVTLSGTYPVTHQGVAKTPLEWGHALIHPSGVIEAPMSGAVFQSMAEYREYLQEARAQKRIDDAHDRKATVKLKDGELATKEVQS